VFQVPAVQEYKAGSRKLTILKTSKLASNMTGQYTCTERGPGNSLLSVTYAVYFYPGKMLSASLDGSSK
jgi:hypothetical protein